jgi:hypothetical protein
VIVWIDFYTSRVEIKKAVHFLVLVIGDLELGHLTPARRIPKMLNAPVQGGSYQRSFFNSGCILLF